MMEQKQFEIAARDTAREAMKVLPPRQRVHFLLQEILNIEDDTAAGAISFAASQLHSHGHKLMARAYERECD